MLMLYSSVVIRLLKLQPQGEVNISINDGDSIAVKPGESLSLAYQAKFFYHRRAVVVVLVLHVNVKL